MKIYTILIKLYKYKAILANLVIRVLSNTKITKLNIKIYFKTLLKSKRKPLA